ncbi:MAG: hypothetical protein VB933_07390 [Pseudomonadales bacterium]
MSIAMIKAIAGAEIRSTRRLARYWPFTILSVVFVCVAVGQTFFMHAMGSGLSASLGSLGPRYAIANTGFIAVVLFLVSLIFLVFDIRHRDVRDRMVEVLDTRPITNTELVLGRCLALVFMTWLPMLFIFMVLQAFGFVAIKLGIPGGTMEPYSVVSFLIAAMTSLALWCALTAFLTLIVRNRLIVTLVAAAILIAQAWAMFMSPAYLAPSLAPLFSFLGDLPSDLMPALLPDGAGERIVWSWLIAAGFIALAGIVHPRADNARKLLISGGGVSLVLAGGLALAIQATQARDELVLFDEWRIAHEERSNYPRADVLSIRAKVQIDPGRELGLDVALSITTPPGEALTSLLWTLNPGLVVEQVTVDDTAVEWHHDSGLLEVNATLTADVRSELRIVASGMPDAAFGYLDSAVDPRSLTPNEAQQFQMLGFQPGLFDRNYVALMPGVRWLPSAGTDIPNGDARTHPPDYFSVDIIVEVPAGWLVAGPGRRITLSEPDSMTGRVRFAFRPPSPVPAVALLASSFERRAMDIDGVTFEILLSPKHLDNLTLFADANDAIRERIEELLTESRRLGLPYPYDGFSLVETPHTLRGFGGGWRLDSVQALPGMVLVKETSFPTARFARFFDDPEELRELEDAEGGIAGFKREVIERFFDNDFTGGNVFLGASRNFVAYQTSATGRGAIALNYVLDELFNRLITGKRGYFSAHEFDSQMGVTMMGTMSDMIQGEGGEIIDSIIANTVQRPAVWDRALASSLAELDPTDDPAQVLNVMALKGGAVADVLYDGLGRQRIAKLLAALVDRYRGGHFDADQFVQTSKDVGVDIEPLLGDWLNEAALPGFLVSNVMAERLAESDDGNAKYQVRFHVRNDESAPGLFRVRYMSGNRKKWSRDWAPTWNNTEPFRLAGYQSVEVGLLSRDPPLEIWLEPYLALNRKALRLDIPDIDFEQRSLADPFLGVKPSEWATNPVDAGIIVDDLDPGFAIEYDDADQLSNFAFQVASDEEGATSVTLSMGPGSSSLEMDQGLPVLPDFFGAGQGFGMWTRDSNEPRSWGKYRRTYAKIAAGRGSRRAIFTAKLPRDGMWQLSYHSPFAGGKARRRDKDNARRERMGLGSGSRLGSYDLTLSADQHAWPLEFDASAAERGWNDLGTFDLTAGTVRLSISDATEGESVIADAIRWIPANRVESASPRLSARIDR